MRIAARALLSFLWFVNHIASGAPAPDTAAHALDTMRVRGATMPRFGLANPLIEEPRLGLSDDINTILFFRPGVNRLAETGSMFLLKGHGPYDNLFFVNGHPVFPPCHFANHPYGDRIGLTLPQFARAGISLFDNTGRWAGAPGGIAAYEPGAFGLKNRPSLTLDIGTMDADLSLSVPFQNGKHLFQTTYTDGSWVTPTSLYWKPYRNTYNDAVIPLGRGEPAGYGDFTFSANNDWQAFESRTFVWVSYDRYVPNLSANPFSEAWIDPWHIETMQLQNGPSQPNWSLSLGNSRQYYAEGKPVGNITPCKYIARSAQSLNFGMDSLSTHAYDLETSLRIDRTAWNAEIRPFPGSDSVLHKTAQTDATISGHMSVHAPNDKPFQAGLALLCGLQLPSQKPFVDPGLSISVVTELMAIQANAGIMTSWPDIRGMPDPAYRNHQIKTYEASLSGSIVPADWTPITAAAYLSWENEAPRLSGRADGPHWDPAAATPLLARGLSFEWKLAPWEWLRLALLQNWGRSQRYEKDSAFIYEWDMPWSTKASLAFRPRGEIFQFFIIGVFSEGLPYYAPHYSQELVPVFSGPMQRVPSYRRIDLKVQCDYHQTRIPFLSSFQGEVLFSDIVNLLLEMPWWNGVPYVRRNIREYAWNPTLQRQPVFCDDYYIYMGLRLGIRL